MRFAKYLLLFVMILGLLHSSVAAKNPSYMQGEVIYHQNFSYVSDFSATGIKKGTASSANSSFSCIGDTFRIDTYDDGRVYAILPSSDWTDSFTIEFDFSFRNTSNPNGYLEVMLTSTGEEPNNISKLTVRMKGTVDDFEAPSELMTQLICSGERINVRIPVENGAVKSLTLSANGITENLSRTGLLLIGSGNRGFSVRNADVDISEIYIVNGINYSEKIGYYAERSYADNSSEDTLPPSDGTETSPETGDFLTVFASFAVAGAAAMIKQLKKQKRCK